MEVMPTTGWVHRLRLAGVSPKELTQPVPEITLLDLLPAARAPEGAAGVGEPDDEPQDQDGDEVGTSAEERRVLRRFARRQPLDWRAGAGAVACVG
jgi:hypothetical protein